MSKELDYGSHRDRGAFSLSGRIDQERRQAGYCFGKQRRSMRGAAEAQA